MILYLPRRNYKAKLISNTLFAGTKKLPKKGSIIREESFMVSGSKATGQLKSGDKVCVYLDKSALMEVQRGHGGWNKHMSDVIKNTILDFKFHCLFCVPYLRGCCFQKLLLV